ncbi:MAG: DUF1415 family protein [Deltaproteobacteria bacterium]|nr:DUF1415 family protein [Deltaproteobacteria bacterium]
MSPPERLTDDEVIARYDRFLVEFIEKLSICPWARHARLGGRLGRSVLRLTEPDVAACVAELQRLTAVPPEELDVAVVILPDLALGAGTFMRFVSSVRDAFTRVSNPPAGYYLVAMHPDMHEDLTDPDRAVGFMRRTPDPSIQLSRVSVITAARGTGRNDRGETASETVARVGLENVLEHGAAEARALLEDIRQGRRR